MVFWVSDRYVVGVQTPALDRCEVNIRLLADITSDKIWLQPGLSTQPGRFSAGPRGDRHVPLWSARSPNIWNLLSWLDPQSRRRPAYAAHTPAWHVCPSPQTFEQAPQEKESVIRFTQMPLHAVSPGAQAGAPATHTLL